ncbi:metallophosphoesterase [Pirellulales bacterium]|nr:metallophosphoesterase [Pirellulales bacterium]
MSPFSWLLISDLHLKATRDTWDQNVVLREMVRDIERQVSSHPKIEFLVVSGDLAHAGNKDEYQLVENFLDALIRVVGLDRTKVFIVPGNHDIARPTQKLSFLGAREVFDSSESVAEFLSNKRERISLMRRLSAYRAFERKYTSGQSREFTEDRLAYIATVSCGDLPISIVGLNSAIACGDDSDKEKIVIGDRPVIDIVEKIRAADTRLVIGVVHHPYDWLRDFDRRNFELRFLPQCDILHRGHLHEPIVSVIPTSDSTNCLVVAAGASYSWRQFKNSYSIVSLDVASCECSSTTFEYNNQSGEFLSRDPITHNVNLRGDLPGNSFDLLSEIEKLDSVTKSFAPYLAALIDGLVTDIPVRIDGRLFIASPELSMKIPGDSLAALSSKFLNIRNCLLAFPKSTTLEERIVHNCDLIREYAAMISALAAENAGFRAELAGRVDQASLLCGKSTKSHVSQFILTLEQLVSDADWDLLEDYATRGVPVDDREKRVALRARANALAHFDDPEKKKEACELANDLVHDPGAEIEDFELAFFVHQAAEDTGRAAELLVEGLNRLGSLSEGLVQAGYRLALATGDANLRRKLDEAKSR